MTDVKRLIERYKEALKEQQENDESLKINLLFGAGVLLGSDCPGASAGVMLALERLFPDQKFPDIGNRSV